MSLGGQFRDGKTESQEGWVFTHPTLHGRPPSKEGKELCSSDSPPSASWEVTWWLLFFKCLPRITHFPECFSYKSVLKDKAYSTFPFLMFGINAPMALLVCCASVSSPQVGVGRCTKPPSSAFSFSPSTFIVFVDIRIYTQWLQPLPTYTTPRSASLGSDVKFMLCRMLWINEYLNMLWKSNCIICSNETPSCPL